MSSKTTTEFGRHDRAICLAKDFFKCIHRGHRGKLHAMYETGNKKWGFTGVDQPGAVELRVLQALVSIASKEGRSLRPKAPSSNDAKELSSVIKATLSPEGEELVYCAIRTSLYRLCVEVGYEDKPDSYLRVLEALKVLAHISIDYEDEEVVTVMDFLGFIHRKKRRDVLIAINPLVAAAVLGGGQFVHIDMNECRTLTGESTRILHQRLCAVVDPGKNQDFKPETLAGYIWTSQAKPGSSTQRVRNGRAVKALLEVGDLEGWKVIKSGKCFKVVRPPLRH